MFKLLSCRTLLALCLLIPGFGEAAVVGVTIGDFWFNPTNIVIRPGDRLVWSNVSGQLHDSTGPTNLWRSGLLGPNATYGFTFTNRGYYPYLCFRHVGTGQTGAVNVVDISLASATKTASNAQFTIQGGRQGLKAVVEAGGQLGTWAPIATNIFPVSGTIRFTNASPPPTNRFYRARVIP